MSSNVGTKNTKMPQSNDISYIVKIDVNTKALWAR